MPNPALVPCVTLHISIGAIYGKYNFGKYNIFPQTWWSHVVCHGKSLPVCIKIFLLCNLQGVYIIRLDIKHNKKSTSSYIPIFWIGSYICFAHYIIGNYTIQPSNSISYTSMYLYSIKLISKTKVSVTCIMKLAVTFIFSLFSACANSNYTICHRNMKFYTKMHMCFMHMYMSYYGTVSYIFILITISIYSYICL